VASLKVLHQHSPGGPQESHEKSLSTGVKSNSERCLKEGFRFATRLYLMQVICRTDVLISSVRLRGKKKSRRTGPPTKGLMYWLLSNAESTTTAAT